MHGPLYIRVLGRVKGPFEWDKLRVLVKRGQLSRIHEVSVNGQDWVKATEYPELFQTAPTEIQQPNAAPLEPAPPEAVEEEPNVPKVSPLQDSYRMEPIAPSAEEWFYDQNGSPMGPVSFSVLQQLVATGQIFAHGRVWKEGMPDWAAAETIQAQKIPPNALLPNGL